MPHSDRTVEAGDAESFRSVPHAQATYTDNPGSGHSDHAAVADRASASELDRRDQRPGGCAPQADENAL